MMRKTLWAEQQQSPRPAVRRPGASVRQLFACFLMWLSFTPSPLLNFSLSNEAIHCQCIF